MWATGAMLTDIPVCPVAASRGTSCRWGSGCGSGMTCWRPRVRDWQHLGLWQHGLERFVQELKTGWPLGR